LEWRKQRRCYLRLEDTEISEGRNKNIVMKAKYREFLQVKFSSLRQKSFQGASVVAVNNDGTASLGQIAFLLQKDWFSLAHL
jgi:hypothetical protein